MLANMGVETNVVCTLKGETVNSEDAREIGNFGNKASA